MSHTTYLITGANRGIGKGLTAALLQRPHTTVVACVRNPSTSTPILTSLPVAATSTLIILKLDSTSETDALTAIQQLTTTHGITSLDVVIANAGTAHSGSPVTQSTPAALHSHFATNTLGPVLLLQAAVPLLRLSPNPVFLALSSLVSSIGAQAVLAGFPHVLSPYGASKAALNWLVQRVHFEEPWLTSYVVNPGLVRTDMASEVFGDELIEASGAVGVEVSVGGILATLDKADRAVSGTFQSYDGTTLPW